MKALEPYCDEFLYTDVDHEGLMQGMDMAAVDAIRAATTRHLSAAGGITTQAEVDALARQGDRRRRRHGDLHGRHGSRRRRRSRARAASDSGPRLGQPSARGSRLSLQWKERADETSSRVDAFAVALMLLVLPALVAAQETERVHKVVPLGPGGTVSLHNFSGAVRIVGADVNEVTIDAVRTASRDRLDHIKLDVQSSGSTVTIEANKKDADWHEQQRQRRQDRVRHPGASGTRGSTINVFSSDVQRPQRLGDAVDRDVLGRRADRGGRGVEHPGEDVLGRHRGGAVGGRARRRTSTETLLGRRSSLRLPDNAAGGAVDFDSFSGKLTSGRAADAPEQRKGHLRADLNGGDPQRHGSPEDVLGRREGWQVGRFGADHGRPGGRSRRTAASLSTQ